MTSAANNVSRRTFLLGASSLTLLALAQRVACASSLPASAEAHIESLIAKMTLHEKAGQLSIFSDTTRVVPKAQINPEAGPPVDRNLAQRVREGSWLACSMGSARPARVLFSALPSRNRA